MQFGAALAVTGPLVLADGSTFTSTASLGGAWALAPATVLLVAPAAATPGSVVTCARARTPTRVARVCAQRPTQLRVLASVHVCARSRAHGRHCGGLRHSRRAASHARPRRVPCAAAPRRVTTHARLVLATCTA